MNQCRINEMLRFTNFSQIRNISASKCVEAGNNAHSQGVGNHKQHVGINKTTLVADSDKTATMTRNGRFDANIGDNTYTSIGAHPGRLPGCNSVTCANNRLFAVF